ncbi:MAG: response regulator [Sulfurimonas sp.]|nr:response regulator [Sulfurimonas sp.]
MNILIADDNSSNRMILKLLLEDFEHENNKTIFKIEEVSNGLKAVEICKNNDFDIILMDIIMPEMDGIEATKIIRKINPNTMIIAVSAVDDSDRQKKILNSGAEDYISKPVNSDIFASRISNYITLVEVRKSKKNCLHTFSKVNLFSSEIFSRRTIFIIDSEDSLSEFWEFFLLNARTKYDNLSDVVRTIFSIAETQLKLSINTGIYIEESDEYQYFTLMNIDKLPPKIVELILKKNLLVCPYKVDDSKISFELSKFYSVDEPEVEEIKNVEIKEELIASEVNIQTDDSAFVSKELQVFDYLDDEDLIDLEEYASKLGSLMLIVGSEAIASEELQEICSYLDRLGSILGTYSEVYPISKALTQLSQDLATYSDVFIQNSEALGPMCKAFASDMSTWIRMSFYNGAPAIDFMNDTIVVNCETISRMLKINEQDDTAVEDLDDIFDF